VFSNLLAFTQNFSLETLPRLLKHLRSGHLLHF